MKPVVIVLALCSVSQALISNQLYTYDRVNDHVLTQGEGDISEGLRLQTPIIFYNKVYDYVTVHNGGFLTLTVSDQEPDTAKEAILAPFMFDLQSENQGNVYYQERTDELTLDRATGDVRRAFADSVLDFDAEAVFVATWEELQSASHPGTNFTFQCIVATDGESSYAIFLYPNDEFGVGDDTKTTRTGLTARVGFNDMGRDFLETLSANELLENGNARSPGEWVFQIGGILLELGTYNEPDHHAKEDAELYRRESGFKVSEVNFNEDYGAEGVECGNQVCDAENGYCSAAGDGFCCQCNDGFFGNGVACIPNDNAVRYNGRISGYSIVMNEDNSWSNETANAVDLHSYVVTKDGRAFSVMNGDLSPQLSRALQPMLIFSSTLGWIFSRNTAPAINGFQLSGGKLKSSTYIRYTTGAYEFRLEQFYDGIIDEENGNGQALAGRMVFSGRLPAVNEGDEIIVNDFSQTYTKTGDGTIRSRGTRSYSVGDVDHEYTIDQTIKYEACEASLTEVPDDQTVDVNAVYIQFIESEGNLRYAMNNHIKAEGGVKETDDTGDSVGVRPTEPPRQPEVPTEEPEVPPPSLTVCERELAEAQRLQDNPNIAGEIFFPTCTDLGTFAPRQCNAYDSVCWCVDADTGAEIPNTRTLPLEGYHLDCSDIRAPPPARTPCEEDRYKAEQDQRASSSGANSIFMPRCMESGAYEPLQQLPDGSFMCVGFDGEELFRSVERPECMTACQLKSYIAQSSNVFRGTSHFVVSCTEDGEYVTKQCVQRYCFCVDKNGFEITDSRVETSEDGTARGLDCDEFTRPDAPEIPEVRPVEPVEPDATDAPVGRPRPREAAKLIFAQSMGINVIDLPVSRGASARRLFARSDQTAVALAYDCANKVYYWTDVSKRVIYSAEFDGNGARSVFANQRIRSPEGISVDFLSGNVYWTDSEYDRIEVAKTDGSNRMTLITGEMSNPRGIAVDPFRGRMYWTDWKRAAPKVWMADMDGSNKRAIVTTNLGLPNDIAIDFYHQKVCFVDAGTKRVECMDLDGSGRETVYTLPSSPVQHPFGLDVNGDVLFYSTWRGSKVVHAVNWRTGEDVPITGPRGAHGQMYGLAVVHPQCPGGYNYCMNNNGGCTHLCLPTPTGRKCKCPPSAVDCRE